MALTLSACAICDRRQPVAPPVQPIVFYPEREIAYPAAETVPYEAYETVPLEPVSTQSELGDITDSSETPRDTMESCLATWHKDTHITRARWREICARMLKGL